MKKYRITYLGPNDELAQVEVSAHSPEAAVQQLGSNLGQMIAVRPVSLGLNKEGANNFDLNVLGQEIATLLRAGLSLTELVEALRSEATGMKLTVLQGIKNHLEEGFAFSAALQAQSIHFPVLFRALIETSEHTANLPDAIEKYLEYAKRTGQLKKQLRNALLYPLLLLGVGFGVLLFLMMYVIPRFASVYESLQGELPWMSQLLLVWGKLLREHTTVVYTILAALVAIAVIAARQPKVHLWVLQRIVFRIPQVAHINRAFMLSRLYRALGILLQGGLPILNALGLLTTLLNNQEQSRLQAVCQHISEGGALSSGLRANKLSNEVVHQLLKAGERSGKTGDMLINAADMLEQESTRTLEAFSRLFEPLVMTLIGLIVGLVVILMYMPIFELAGSLQ